MAKRLFDLLFGSIGVVLSAPIVLLSGICIRVSSPGPVFYPARRVGRYGVPFTMWKLRTMHVQNGNSSSITAPDDERVFAFGRLIRNLKIDELPQFWNVVRGDLSIVGPRAEAPEIVENFYTSWMRETLSVRPGLTSPGAIYNYIMADRLLDPGDPEMSYVNELMPAKLALERAYLERASLRRDLMYIGLTVWAIVGRALGFNARLPESDIARAQVWASEGLFRGL
ncbi:sugar transferase [Thioalkalivibrio sp. XN8]|uniref:sugar transferase n=1 Tax=Thioalkalivibrio sp. XN8 TaxID=2712863 RepID=UPI0013ECA520|nr:sugar transferase [Thioalkalivibrio sp. XN8]NGP53785.1 sugar transferase [Thioalkalivibrio sp. XN8]